MRLSQILFSQGFGTRRECDLLLHAGEVVIDGKVCEEPGEEFDTEGLVFTVAGQAWPYHDKAYLLMHKPAAYECSQKPSAWPSIYSLLPMPLRRRNVQAVGRLDQDTTGLLILTDDGVLIHRLTSPKKHVAKVYEVGTADPVDSKQVAELLAGVVLHDDPMPVRAAACEITGERALRLTLTEGKYHQVKRMVAAAGNHVAAPASQPLRRAGATWGSRAGPMALAGRAARHTRPGRIISTLMQVFRGFHHAALAPACALTIGNLDGVHRGHQAMLALLHSEARHRGLPSCVLTFEPHPRDYFAAVAGKPELAPARIATLRDKLTELQRCEIDQVVVLRFDRQLSSLAPQAFIKDVLVEGLGTKYVLVGDDFRFGAKRAGDYAMLDATGDAHGFDVARMMSYEVHGQRVSSSAVREALATGDMEHAARLLGRPYSISGHVIHGRKLGRNLGFRTLNLRFHHRKAAAHGIFAVRTHGLADKPIDGVASLGIRPTVEDAGRVLLEVYCLDWPEHLGAEGGYGKIVRVELLHKLRDEARFDDLDALQAAIDRDVENARTFFASLHEQTRRQTTRDRI